ncbi:hypothetical protein LINPERHAP1_LOCUS8560 [Linum perenne]
MILSHVGTPDRHHRAMAMFYSPPRKGDNQVQRRDLPTDSHMAKRKLKDLFVSSPPFDDHHKQN